MTKPFDTINKILEGATDSLFQPTDDHRKAKSTFWLAVSDGLVSSSRLDPDLSTALKFANNTAISRWWDLPGFIDWFYNKEEFRQQAAYVGQKALEELERVINSTAVKSKDKIPAIKLALELSGKLTKPESESIEDKIGKMTREQVQEFARKRAHLIDSPEITQPSVSDPKKLQ